jgi:hypothetical protein
MQNKMSTLRALCIECPESLTWKDFYAKFGAQINKEVNGNATDELPPTVGIINATVVRGTSLRCGLLFGKSFNYQNSRFEYIVMWCDRRI